MIAWEAIEKRKLVVALRKPVNPTLLMISPRYPRKIIEKPLLTNEVDDGEDESPQVCEEEETNSNEMTPENESSSKYQSSMNSDLPVLERV